MPGFESLIPCQRKPGNHVIAGFFFYTQAPRRDRRSACFFDDLCVLQTALRHGNLPSQLPCGLNPFLRYDLDVVQCLCHGLAVCHASGQLRDLRNKGADRLNVDDLLDVVSRVNEMISENPAVEAEPIEDQPQI